AALANSDALSIYAETVLGVSAGAPLSLKRRDRAFTALRNAGLVSINFDGALTLVPDAIANALERSAEPKREGVDRFVRNGRVERYPMKPADRLEVLEWVANHVFKPDEVLTEQEVNERLAPIDSDVAALRRYLV